MTTISLSDWTQSPEIVMGKEEHKRLTVVALTNLGERGDNTDFLLYELDRARITPENPPPACRRGVDWIDPLIWARELHKLEKGKSLGDVAARVGVDVDPHGHLIASS